MRGEHKELIDNWVQANPFKANAYRDAIIEECARVADTFKRFETLEYQFATDIAAAIRALKDQW